MTLPAIKLLHTAVWAVFAGAIVALPVAAWRGAFNVAFGLIGLISVELAILAVNGGSCPLTAVAARRTEDRQPNFDIYLPMWLARWNKVVFGVIWMAVNKLAYELNRRNRPIHCRAIIACAARRHVSPPPLRWSLTT